MSGHHQLVLAAVIRHLDHKNVALDPQVKSYVIEVAAALAQQIRSGAVLTEIGYVSDLCRHLRKSLQAAVESAGEQESNLNISLQNSIEDCLLEIAKGVSLMHARNIWLLLSTVPRADLNLCWFIRFVMHDRYLTLWP
jgi:ABC-type histidine transport system ATPase subunit